MGVLRVTCCVCECIVSYAERSRRESWRVFGELCVAMTRATCLGKQGTESESV